MVPNTRRDFLADVGRGMLLSSVGLGVATDLGLAAASAADAADTLNFGKLEPLVALLQETPLPKLNATLVARLKEGTDLRTLVAAGALANARTFGGRHYEGYHTFMALAPAFQMAQELPEAQKPLPVLKVLYRNSTHIQTTGGRKNEVLHPVAAEKLPEGKVGGEAIQECARRKDHKQAEAIFAGIAHGEPEDAFNHAMYTVADDINVHRVVLAWRAWAMLDFCGKEHAHTLLRQTVLFCCNENRQQPSGIQTLLPKLMDQHKLMGKKLGTREADDAWVEAMAKTIYGAGRDKAAEAAAAALAEGFSPAAVSEAMCIAANQLLLCDQGRTMQQVAAFKPVGSVHGDSVGLHASDAANAWRNIARVSNQRNVVASMIVGAYHTAGQNNGQNGLFHEAELANVKAKEPAEFLTQTEAAIKAGNQAAAAALVQKYGEANHPTRPLLDLLLKYGVTEDGALHAEKYYRTATEEFGLMRPKFRWNQLVALARVTASETGAGKPAPGLDEAKKLLGA